MSSSTPPSAPVPGTASFVVPPVPARGRPLRHLLSDGARRPGGRRVLSLLSSLLLLSGVLLFSYPVGTDLYSTFRQGSLSDDFGSQASRASYRAGAVGEGEGLTRLKIPEIGVDVLVVQGTSPAALRAGAGHYPDTPLPGEEGNVGIAGHRTTYGRPFNRLDELRPGDELTLETPLAVHTYRAVGAFDGHANPWVVLPTDVSVVAPAPGAHELTLTTCHPKGSAKQRLVMRFELVGSTPVPRAA